MNLNFNYAAKIHRDSNNLGPSVTKAFGEYAGGELRYWEHDDGRINLSELQKNHNAAVLDTRGSLCLFDGNRAHAVEPFVGERYSLVFFTVSAVGRARDETLSVLSSLGANIPSRDALRYVFGYISPARGYDFGQKQASIRDICGKEALPTSISWRKHCFLGLGQHCLAVCISFVIRPHLMSTLAAVTTKIAAVCKRHAAWADTVVDPEGRRPEGRHAKTHYRMWALAKGVVTGSWEHGHVGFLCSSLVAWTFLEMRNPPMLVSARSVPPHGMTLLFSLENRAKFKGKIKVGVAAGVSCPFQIEQALAGKAPPNRDVVVACAVFGSRSKAFQLNQKTFGPTALPTSRLQGIVKFACEKSRLRLVADGLAPIEADVPVVDTEKTFVCFVSPALPPGNVKPCWGRLCR